MIFNTIKSSEDRARFINDSGYKIVLAITGGGSDAIGNILRYGGGSKSLLEAIIPYSTEAFDLFVGGKVDKYCSEEASRALAMASFQRAKRLAPGHDLKKLLGVGATCSLTKDNERSGRSHTLYLTIICHSCVITYRKVIGLGSRLTQETNVADYIADAIKETCYNDDTIDNDGVEIAYGFELAPGQSTLNDEQREFIRTTSSYAVFPGSFNPMHEDHYNIVKEFVDRKVPIFLEISTHNVDKLPLNHIEIDRRKAAIMAKCHRFDPKYFKGVVFTNAPKFVDKAKVFNNAMFVVGTDTVNRLLDVKYYDNEHDMFKSIDIIKYNGCKFVIFPRSGFILTDFATTVLQSYPGQNMFSVVHSFYSHGYSSSDIRNKANS